MVELKLEPKEAYAILLVFLLSAGVWHFPPKTTLPEFGAAIQLSDALGGKAALPHISLAALVAKAAGASPEDKQSIVSFLLWFPSALLGFSSVFLYLSCRALGLRRTVSAFAAALFAVSLSSLAFAPGVYSSLPLAAALFSLYAFSFALFARSKSAVALAFSALFAFSSGYAAFAFGIAAALLALSFCAAYCLKGGKPSSPFLLLAAIAAASAALSPSPHLLPFSPGSLEQGLGQSGFLLAAASCSAALSIFRSGKGEYGLLFASGAILVPASPLAASSLLVLPAAEGISEASSERHGRQAKLSCAFAAAFFAFLAMAAPQIGVLKGAAASALLAAIAPLLLHFYDYGCRQFFHAAALCLFSLALFSAYLLQGLQASAPSYLNPDLASTLLFLSGKGASGAAMLSGQDAAAFYLPKAKLESQQDVASYLSKGSPRLPSGTYIVVALSDIDSPSAFPSAAFESYSYVGNFTSQNGREVALFSSREGRLLLREIGLGGEFALKDGALVNSAGQAYATVPLSAMLKLKPQKPMQGAENRLIVLEEGASPPYFMKIFSGSSPDTHAVFESGSVSVYQVN